MQSHRFPLRQVPSIAYAPLALAALAACGGSGDTTGSGGATGSTGATMSATATGVTSSNGATSSGTTGSGGAGTQPTVFMILLENNNWDAFKNSPKAPYINQTLLTLGAHAEQYKNPAGVHPSEPNYLWLEAGTNFGILDDNGVSSNAQSTTDHLVTQLEAAGLSWKSYQEGIDGTTCPLADKGKYAPRHNPVVFFKDVSNNNDPTSPRCIQHVRPYAELATDLAAGTVGRYNFITPDLCHDGHDVCAPENDQVKQSDDWLAAELPKILDSAVYKANGIVLITWDEGEGNSDGPIGLIAISKYAKAGYSNSIAYDHSSTLKTVQTILKVSPFLGSAGHPATQDLSDLFTSLP